MSETEWKLSDRFPSGPLMVEKIIKRSPTNIQGAASLARIINELEALASDFGDEFLFSEAVENIQTVADAWEGKDLVIYDSPFLVAAREEARKQRSDGPIVWGTNE